MKQIILPLFIMLLFILLPGQGFGQSPADDPARQALKRHLQMREEIHRRIMDKLLLGNGEDGDLFKDMDLFFQSDSLDNKNFSMAWEENQTGRVLKITPQSEKQQLDIKVEKGMITIKGESKTNLAQGSAVSSFSNSFNVPTDCDPDKMKMEQVDGKIVMTFPYLQQLKKIKNNGRTPLNPSEEDINI